MNKLSDARVVIREVAANALMAVPGVATLRSLRGRTSEPADTVKARRYAFGLIIDNPSIRPFVAGADVLEIGPGDHLATGLALLAYGARSYTVLDRFRGNYRSADARAWYGLVEAEWAKYFDRPWPPDLNIDTFPFRLLDARSTEDLDALPQAEFDLVLSQAVGEHVSDIDAFAQATARLLRPNGVAMHNIDFSTHGFSPELFSSAPDWLWHLMGSRRGLPNRKTFSEFEAAFRRHLRVTVVGRSATWASFFLSRADAMNSGPDESRTGNA
jgi:SAM-dependent methyltransferase